MGAGEREQPSRKENDMAQGKGGTFFFLHRGDRSGLVHMTKET